MLVLLAHSKPFCERETGISAFHNTEDKFLLWFISCCNKEIWVLNGNFHLWRWWCVCLPGISEGKSEYADLLLFLQLLNNMWWLFDSLNIVGNSKTFFLFELVFGSVFFEQKKPGTPGQKILVVVEGLGPWSSNPACVYRLVSPSLFFLPPLLKHSIGALFISPCRITETLFK